MEFNPPHKQNQNILEIEDPPIFKGISDQEVASILDKYLEKMIVLKKNFLAKHYKTKDLSNQNKSVLSQAELTGVNRDPVPEAQNKSVSTEVSIYQIIDNISNDDLPDNKDSQKFIGNHNYSQYLQKVNKYFKSILSFVQKENDCYCQ